MALSGSIGKNLFMFIVTYYTFYGLFRKLFDTHMFLAVPPFLVCFFVLVLMVASKEKYPAKIILAVFVLSVIPFISSLSLIMVNPYIIVVSLLNYSVYIWLIFLGYSLAKNANRLTAVLKYISALSLIVASFGIFQFFMNEHIDSPVMVTLENERSITGHSFGDQNIFFITSFFDVVTRMDSFLLAAFFINIYLSKITAYSKYLYINWLIFFVMIVSGHRTPAVVMVFSMIFIFMYQGEIRLKHICLVTLVSAMVFFAAVVLVEELWFYITAFYYVKDRLWWFVFDAYHAYEAIGFWGMGSGYASQGIKFIPGGELIFATTKDLISFKVNTAEYGAGFAYFEGIESGLAKYIVEFGILISLIILFSIFYLVFTPIRFRKAKFNILGGYTISILVWNLLVHHQIFGDFVTLSIFWFIVGVQWKLANMYASSQVRVMA